MKILSPINSHEEVEPLVKAGAGEFFCGYVPKEWSMKYTDAFSLNRRHLPVNQVNDITELEKIICLSKENNIKVHITLNALYYIDEQKEFLLNYIGQLKEIGVEALIITSLPLIKICKNIGTFYLILSGEALPINSESIRLYREIGINRIVFPRDITLNEIKGITSLFPDLDFEAFIMRERCIYCGGTCFTSHGIRKTNFCREPWKQSLKSLNSEILTFEEYRQFKENSMAFKMLKEKDYIDLIEGTKVDIRNSDCGACAIKKLSDYNVMSLKVVGRGIPLNAKIAHINFIKACVELAEKVNDNYEYVRKVQELRNMQDYCNSRLKCYYYDFMD